MTNIGSLYHFHISYFIFHIIKKSKSCNEWVGLKLIFVINHPENIIKKTKDRSLKVSYTYIHHINAHMYLNSTGLLLTLSCSVSWVATFSHAGLDQSSQLLNILITETEYILYRPV